MVEGTHFNLGPRCGPEDVGHRALAGALSDLAAMGAAPGEAYLCVVLPPALGRGRRARPAPRGGGARARLRGTTIAGGDLTRGPGADGRGDRGRLGGERARSSSAATARGPATSSA